MKADDDSIERCPTCGRETSGERSFCHFYRDGGRLTFCSPRCAEIHLYREADAGSLFARWVDGGVGGEGAES